MGAAEKGGALACTTAAALWAAGVCGRPDWNRALDYLRRSAELGFPPAQAQLRLLAGHSGAGQGGDDWKALRRAIDIKAWRQPPRPRALCREPRVFAFEGMVSPAVCDWIVALARDRLRPAMVYDAAGADAPSAGRSNSAVELNPGRRGRDGCWRCANGWPPPRACR
ncbi:MAG: hypothetical protein WDN45_08975 [Caulobacteraceae bacterium]